MSAIRDRILGLELPGVTIEDDGRVFSFVRIDQDGASSVVLWQVGDGELHRLAQTMAAEARTAWGTRNADGLYFVMVWLQEAIDQFDGDFGRIELAGGCLSIS